MNQSINQSDNQSNKQLVIYSNWEMRSEVIKILTAIINQKTFKDLGVLERLNLLSYKIIPKIRIHKLVKKYNEATREYKDILSDEAFNYDFEDEYKEFLGIDEIDEDHEEYEECYYHYFKSDSSIDAIINFLEDRYRKIIRKVIDLTFIRGKLISKILSIYKHYEKYGLNKNDNHEDLLSFKDIIKFTDLELFVIYEGFRKVLLIRDLGIYLDHKEFKVYYNILNKVRNESIRLQKKFNENYSDDFMILGDRQLNYTELYNDYDLPNNIQIIITEEDNRIDEYKRSNNPYCIKEYKKYLENFNNENQRYYKAFRILVDNNLF
jgi:hypothetical protein